MREKRERKLLRLIILFEENFFNFHRDIDGIVVSSYSFVGYFTHIVLYCMCVYEYNHCSYRSSYD